MESCDMTGGIRCENNSPQNFHIYPCYVCRRLISSEFPALAPPKNQLETQKHHANVSLCTECLSSLKNSRSLKRINDLPSEMLHKIFDHLHPNIWLETLRFVCSQWQKNVDDKFSKICTIRCNKFQNPSNSCLVTLHDLQSKISGEFPCSVDNLRYCLQMSNQRLKTFVSIDCHTEQNSCDPMFDAAIRNLHNLTKLSLDCILEKHAEHLDCLFFPQLRLLSLFNQLHCEVSQKLQSAVANFLSKHRKIGALTFASLEPGMDSILEIGNLKLQQFIFFILNFFETDKLQCLLNSLLQSSNLLESLILVFHHFEQSPLNLQLYHSFCEQLNKSQKLKSFHFSCSFCSHKWCDQFLIGLNGLSSLTDLKLSGFVFCSTLEFPQNHLTAGQLLAPTLRNLTKLSLDGWIGGRFYEEAFGGGLPRLKELCIHNTAYDENLWDITMELGVLNLCPNLEKFTFKIENWSIEVLNEVHEIVHKCQSAPFGLGNVPNRQLLLCYANYSSWYDVGMHHEWKLCGVKAVNSDISVSRVGCF